MNKNLTCITVLIMLFLSAPSKSAPLNFKTVSKCFFIYAPITEAGRDMNIPSIFTYGQKRMAWFMGFMKANEKNEKFTYTFEVNLNKNKEFAIALEEQFRSSIKNQQLESFDEIISFANGCDRFLGIKTKDSPSLPLYR